MGRGNVGPTLFLPLCAAHAGKSLHMHNETLHTALRKSKPSLLWQKQPLQFEAELRNALGLVSGLFYFREKSQLKNRGMLYRQRN